MNWPRTILDGVAMALLFNAVVGVGFLIFPQAYTTMFPKEIKEAAAPFVDKKEVQKMKLIIYPLYALFAAGHSGRGKGSPRSSEGATYHRISSNRSRCDSVRRRDRPDRYRCASSQLWLLADLRAVLTVYVRIQGLRYPRAGSVYRDQKEVLSSLLPRDKGL